ncbi:hypothetical protein C5167_013943 [Papaver somniferum]|uniref:Uncharacterized protein n=1 Tax=Papaver somniferum TaxID=3469 RepID=A0A4Y7J562_PAPSO|nr:uncharacterized protein LOC113357040 [Papaver somniferum]XP_026456090.1 uncharacterized protein LOC113357040 [Papaver somniferum]RZC55081.1 hypothetical protein C5167_013943 [Papaver somniferum]
METESSDDISSGCPSPFTDLGDAQVPLGREAVRGNDFSSTVFVDDNLTSKDNASPAHDSILSPGHIEPTCDNGEKVIQPPFPTESLLDCNLFSARGMMGSGSTNPCPENENVRVCRAASILQSDTGISRPVLASPSLVQPINEPDCGTLLKTMTAHYDQFLKSGTQLNDAQKQLALGGGADVGMRREIARLESKNTKLSAALRVLTEELAGVRQELADTKSRELQLQLSLEEIRVVLPDSWEY